LCRGAKARTKVVTMTRRPRTPAWLAWLLVPAGAACDGPGPSGPAAATRTPDDVCAQAARFSSPAPAAIPLPLDCTPPELPAVALEEALATLNHHRWLAGLAPVWVWEPHQRLAEEAALLVAKTRRVGGTPDPSWACHNAEVASAYLWSSRALGVSSPAAAIATWVDEPDRALPNRAWLLDPLLGGVGFGQVGDAATLYVRGTTPQPVPAFVAYPGPGAFALSELPATWSFSVAQSLEGARVSVTLPDGSRPGFFSTPARRAAAPGELDSVSFFAEAPLEPGRYRVDVSTATARWGYEVELVDCQR
jgi:hypothetical protein